MPAHVQLAPLQSGTALARSPERRIRVLLADDHALVRRSLRLLLELEQDLEVVAEARDLGTVMREVHGHRPHVLVIDLRMRDGSSIEAIRGLRQRVPSTEIIVLTMDDSPGFVRQTRAAGAIGYVLKDRADTELPEAVRHAAHGETYLSPQVAVQLSSLQRSVTNDGLTLREAEVLRLTALGHTSREIGTRLHLSTRTVETHRSSIHHKLGLATRADLVRYALARGLLGA